MLESVEEDRCDSCLGEGTVNYECARCNGYGIEADQRTCSACEGEGSTPSTCPTCNGKGTT